MKPTSMLRLFLLGCGSWLALPAAPANTLYWDGGTVDIAGNGDSAASGLSGNWSTSLLNWDAGPVPYAGWNNSNNDIAFFHRGTAIPGPNPGTVSLQSNITVGGLVFNASTFTLSTGANALTFGAANNTVALNNSATAANITGTIGSSSANMIFTAQNPLANHTLTFNGANTSGWSGTTTINAGLTLATTSTSGNINQALNSTSGITLNGGAIQFNRATNAALNAINDSAAITVNGGGTFGATSADAGGASANETIGAVTLNSGQMNFNWTNNPSSGGVIIMSNLIRSGGTSALTISQGNNGRFRNAAVTTDTAANEIIGAWATIGAQNSINAQTDYAIYSGGNGTFLARNIAASAQSTWSTSHASTSNYTLDTTNVTVAANGRLDVDRNINTLRNRTFAAAPSLVDAGTDYITMAGNTLQDGDVVVSRNTTGGQLTQGRAYYVIDAGGAGAGTFRVSATPGGSAVNLTTSAAGFISAGMNLNGNTLGTYGILNGSSDPFAIGGGSGSSVTLPTTTSGNLYVTNGNASVWIDVPVTDNGAGVLTLVKGGSSGNGSGNVTLSGDNTYTGGTVVNSGNLTFSGTNTFTAGDIINGGSITYSTIASWGGTGRDVTFNGTGTLTSTVGGYSAGTLTTNAGANAVIASAASGANSIAFAATTGAGNVIYNTSHNRLLNLGDASGLTGNLQARTTTGPGYNTGTTVQFSSLGDAAGSALQFVGGTGDSNQAMTFSLVGTSALTFNDRQVQILDRVNSNWELRDNIIANNSANAAHTWTINTDLLYTGGRAITAFGGSLQTNRRFILSGSNTGDNAFNGVIGNGQNSNGLLFEKAGSGKWILGGDNTYTGATTVSGGTLEVVSLADGGSSSSLGASSNAAGNLLLGNGSTLRYNGDGDSTDRGFTINGNGAGLQATLDASGLGAVHFTNTASPGYGTTNQTRTLNLRGTNTQANTLAANIANNGSGAVSIVKNDDGTWVLSGDNQYTGTTTVTAGTLVINGSTHSSSVVTVAAAGTIGGIGTVGGNTTVNGTLSPGQSPGTLTFGGNLTLNNLANYFFEGGDLTNVFGVLDLNDNWTLTLGGGLQDGGSVMLFDYGTLAASPDITPTFDITALGFTPSGSLTLTDTGSAIMLNGVSVVPEPRAALLGGLGLLLILRRRR